MYQREGASAYKADLSNTIKLVNYLGNPQDDFKSIHVAGTNGKGSTVAILESILIESGYSVGSYTSPHLLEFNERIKINKIPASTKEICNAFEIIEESRKDITLTYFEFSTLAAFIIFSQKMKSLGISFAVAILIGNAQASK